MIEKFQNWQNGAQKKKDFFKHVNSKLKTRSRIADLKITDEQVINDNTEKVHQFYEFYSSVYTREDLNGIQDVTRQEPMGHQDLSRVEIDETEVLDVFSQIDKSPGPDGSHPRVLKRMCY